MSAPGAGTYLLVGSVFYRNEGDGDEAVRRRYKRGDKVKLSKAEAARLAAPSRLAPATFIKDSDDVEVARGADLVTSPPLVVNRVSEANQLVGEVNSGLGTPPEAHGLSDDQVANNAESRLFPPVTGAGAGDLVPAGDLSATAPSPITESGKPARSATAEVWRDHAVKVGAVTEADAAPLTKGQLQEKVAEHEAKTAAAG